jgi:hypothetical protein
MPISIRGEDEDKKIIIIPVSNSVIPEDTQSKDYNANDDGILVEQVPGKVINVEDEKPMGGVITPLIPPSIIFKDGHGHLKYQGAPEMQFNRLFDSYSCVIYTIAKAICYNLRERYNIDITISEMFNAYYANVRQGVGTTIRAGMESFRLHGWVEDKDYPFTAETTLKQFQQQPPIEIVNKATGELTKWKFNWEVLGRDHNSIKENLKRTVICGTGFAWASYYGEGVYYDYNNPANHAFLIVDYKINDKGGINLIADDSYPRDNRFDDDSTPDEFIKELDASYSMGSCHRVWLTPVLPQPNNKTLINKITNMFLKIGRSIHGAFFFIKDGKKAEINSWKAAFGAIIDEVGILPANNNLTDEKLSSIPDYPFFGK